MCVCLWPYTVSVGLGLRGLGHSCLKLQLFTFLWLGCVTALYIKKDPPQSLHDPYVTPGLLKIYAAHKATH